MPEPARRYWASSVVVVVPSKYRPRLSEPDYEGGSGSLSVSPELDAEVVGDIAQRTLGEGGELARVAPGRTPPNTVTLRQQHTLGRAARREERRRNASNASTEITTPVRAVPSGGQGGPVGTNWAIHGDLVGWSTPRNATRRGAIHSQRFNHLPPSSDGSPWQAGNL